jgi:hypothetical protein
MALSAILPGCDNDQIPPYAGVVINEPEEPEPPTFVPDTAAFVRGLEGTWQLYGEVVTPGLCGDDGTVYYDSALFYTFTVAEYTYNGKLEWNYSLRQKGELTIRRDAIKEDPVPYEYVYMAYFEAEKDYDSIANLALGNTAFCCSLGGNTMSIHLPDVDTVTGTKRLAGPYLLFRRVE